MSFWNEGSRLDTSRKAWIDSLRRACDWSANISQVRSIKCPYEETGFPHAAEHSDWRGSFRGEYATASQSWDVFCPIWHGGQGVKALAMAAPLAGEDYLAAARDGADFILRNQIREKDHKDYGHILSYEAGSPAVNTSATLESLDGLFALSAATGEKRYSDAAIEALDWVAGKLFMPEEGLMHDDYDPKTGNIQPTRFGARNWNIKGRPLIDDGVYLTGARLTGRSELAQVAVKIADRLLADENPSGNWVAYPPADRDTGLIHPRHAYWWGRPLWMLYRETGDKRYLECARRSAQWYVSAMRNDGGLFRHTDAEFKTPSFGHATSGIACAAILWLELVREFGDEQWLEPARKALSFCRSVQFVNASDKNLEGSILEKVVHPAGSDAPPWYLRDVGTFFYIQAVALALEYVPEALA